MKEQKLSATNAEDISISKTGPVVEIPFVPRKRARFVEKSYKVYEEKANDEVETASIKSSAEILSMDDEPMVDVADQILSPANAASATVPTTVPSTPIIHAFSDLGISSEDIEELSLAEDFARLSSRDDAMDHDTNSALLAEPENLNLNSDVDGSLVEINSSVVRTKH